MRVALDTNVLAYAAGVKGPARKDAAVQLLNRLRDSETFLPVQVLGELFLVLTRKAGFSSELSRKTILRYHDTYPLLETTPKILVAGTDLVVDHQIGIWDAVILAAAASGGCRLLLSEDFQDEFTWAGVTVVNPFAAKRHELLSEALGE